jgi:hypothetical protein
MDDNASPRPPHDAAARSRAPVAGSPGPTPPARPLAEALTAALGSLAALRGELLLLHARLETAPLIRRLRERSRG